MTIKEMVEKGLPLSGIEVIDAHAHLGPWHAFYLVNPTTESMIRLMDRLGTKWCFISPHLALGPDVKLGNELVLQTISKFPDRIRGYVTVNPHYSEELIRELEHYFLLKEIIGIKVHPDMHNYPIDAIGYEPMWKFANLKKAVVLAHTWPRSPNCALGMFRKVAEKYPDCAIILAHSGGTDEVYWEAIEVAKAYPHTYLDITGSRITAYWIERFVEEVGEDRVIYGTDFPFLDPRFCLGRVCFTKLSDRVKEKILGGNIKRLLSERGKW